MPSAPVGEPVLDEGAGLFTGIIEEVGRVERVEELGGGRRITVAGGMAPELRIDQSVSVNGACQTVVAVEGDTFSVVSIEETLRKTTLGALTAGAPVNLERALQPTGRLDGHFVQGHVDTTGVVAGVEELATSRLYRVRFAPEFAAYLIPVGSVAIDGVSLTVARLEGEEFTVAIIPYTLAHTALGETWQTGARVNLEFDLIGKYIVRAVQLGNGGAQQV